MTDWKEIASYAVILIIVLIAAQHLNVVVSGSMEPAFYRGDIVMIQKADFFGIHEFNVDDINVGDVVVYDAKWFNQPVIHRVINITDVNGTTMYVIKGDNNNAPDPYYVTKGQIESKVVTFGDNLVVIPKIGYLSLWLRGL
jgi:signal peptidase